MKKNKPGKEVRRGVTFEHMLRSMLADRFQGIPSMEGPRQVGELRKAMRVLYEDDEYWKRLAMWADVADEWHRARRRLEIYMEKTRG